MREAQLYAETVYAGVLGKLIGVYLGRPIEGWPYERIRQTFGEVQHYVHGQVGVPLVVADDDLSGTFGFFRVLEDNGLDAHFSPQAAGHTWLNYIIEDKTILWWGGLGRSTEHTAYLRLKAGVPAPDSGSIRLNGPTLAQQIGAQIFMDAFALMSPNDPEQAASLVRRSASVSHDGVALEAACFLAAMEALAFGERNLDALFDGALPFVQDPLLLRVIADVRSLCARESDWRAVRAWLDERYGYERFDGPCHIVPNHAMVLAALLMGGDDFQRSIAIAASAGWDTDCNAGNVGCLNGIRLGLAGIEGGADFRTAVADRLYVVTADGGACITDAVQQTRAIVRAASAAQDKALPARAPRFGFEFPGSVQGFGVCPLVASPGVVSELRNERGEGLGIEVRGLGTGQHAAVSTPVFLEFGETHQNFSTLASPTLYSTQIVRARLMASTGGLLAARLYVAHYDLDNRPRLQFSEPSALVPGENTLDWTVPDTGGMPIFRLGVRLEAGRRFEGRVTLRSLDWTGAPTDFTQRGMMMTSIWNVNPSWLQAWVSSAKHFAADFKVTYCVSHPGPEGIATIGTGDWGDYQVHSVLNFSLHARGGLVARSKGHRRYYAALLEGGHTARLVKVRDDQMTILAERHFAYRQDHPYALQLAVAGDQLVMRVENVPLLSARDPEPYSGGAAGFLIDSGTMTADGFRVSALHPEQVGA